MTTVTVGGLTPGSSYVFGLAVILPDGIESSISDTVSMSTLPLPSGGHTVRTASVSAGASSTTYTASILVPYAFIRLFLYSGDCLFGTANQNVGWPINYDQWDNVCNQYMVEGGTLFKYGGSYTEGVNMPWSWTSVGDVPRVQSGYQWTWTVPIGSSTIDTNSFIVQVPGYGPTFNVFNKCPWGVSGNSKPGSQYCFG